MSRYLASAGIRHIQGAAAKPDIYPFVVIIGPSGQVGQIHGPSGAATFDPATPTNLQAYEQTINHKALAFYKNEILYSLRDAIGTLHHEFGYAWMPYGALPDAKVNPGLATITDEAAPTSPERYMMDGYNHKVAFPKCPDWYKQQYSFYKMPGGSLFWCYPLAGQGLVYGFYEGKDPHFIDAGATSGWKCQSGIIYNRNNMPCQEGLISYRLDGVNRSRTSPNGTLYSSIPCDIIYHKNTLFIAFQHCIVGLIPGGKGGFIHHNDLEDTDIQAFVPGTTLYPGTSYATRILNEQLGSYQTRSFALHQGNLYLLQGDGKIFEVHTAGLKQISNISTLSTPWCSGLYGGYVREANQTAWAGAAAYRCYMTSFNGQLHAFLNFRSTHKVAKATDGSATNGRGIIWATSFDGSHWTDQSPNLPGSGIQATSGSLANWLTEIRPYQISGFTGYNRALYSQWQAIASGKALGFKRCQPSGLRQHTMIPWIVNSGTMVDAAGTPFGSLQCPLNRGAISGFLFPTWVQKPGSFSTYGSPNKFRPKGIGASGYDYTGCHNWHISGFSDDQDSKLKLLFTEDFHGIGTWGSSLLYELNKTSGWKRVNYLAKSNQLNGLIPIDLYDPEILIPSGDFYNPNPRVDESNRTLTINYRVYDWPYWSKVTTRLEYSLDHGYTWNYAGGQRAVSTGTQQTDPSGIVGGAGSITWNYGDTLSHSTEYPNVQLRLRAQED